MLAFFVRVIHGETAHFSALASVIPGRVLSTRYTIYSNFYFLQTDVCRLTEWVLLYKSVSTTPQKTYCHNRVAWNGSHYYYYCCLYYCVPYLPPPLPRYCKPTERPEHTTSTLARGDFAFTSEFRW